MYKIQVIFNERLVGAQEKNERPECVESRSVAQQQGLLLEPPSILQAEGIASPKKPLPT